MIGRSSWTTAQRGESFCCQLIVVPLFYLTSVDNDRTLEALNLPAALEALERPVGLPPSLLQKAEEVRAEDGPTRIEASIENVQKLAQQDMDILNEASLRPQSLGAAS